MFDSEHIKVFLLDTLLKNFLGKLRMKMSAFDFVASNIEYIMGMAQEVYGVNFADTRVFRENQKMQPFCEIEIDDKFVQESFQIAYASKNNRFELEYTCYDITDQGSPPGQIRIVHYGMIEDRIKKYEDFIHKLQLVALGPALSLQGVCCSSHNIVYCSKQALEEKIREECGE